VTIHIWIYKTTFINKIFFVYKNK